MKTSNFQKITAILLLTLFTCGNVFGFQTFLHDHDHDHDQKDPIEECLVCDKALLDQFTPLDFTEQYENVSQHAETIQQELVNEYSSVIRSTEISALLFSRPPPALI